MIKHLEASKFAEILLRKAIVHDNIAVRRFCVKGFLKFKLHVKNFENFVFSSLFEILNTAVFYNDVSYEEDSKFYPVLTSYFAEILENSAENPEKLQENLRNFLKSIEKFTVYCHPLIALFRVFEELSAKYQGNTQFLRFFGKQELKTLENIVKKNYEPLQFRKRIQFFNSIVQVLLHFVDFSQVDFEFLLNFLEFYPLELVNFKSFVNDFARFPVFEMIKNREISKEFVNCDFLHREKIVVWVLLVEKNLHIRENIKNFVQKCQK